MPRGPVGVDHDRSRDLEHERATLARMRARESARRQQTLKRLAGDPAAQARLKAMWARRDAAADPRKVIMCQCQTCNRMFETARRPRHQAIRCAPCYRAIRLQQKRDCYWKHRDQYLQQSYDSGARARDLERHRERARQRAIQRHALTLAAAAGQTEFSPEVIARPQPGARSRGPHVVWTPVPDF